MAARYPCVCMGTLAIMLLATGCLGATADPNNERLPILQPRFSARCTMRSSPDAAKLTPAFKQKVVQICRDIRIPNPDFLLACMAFESGMSFCSSIRNAASGATGLIQFMPSTARGLGTTTDALAAMSEIQQLDWVKKYFQPHTGKLSTMEDIYMAILWPAAIGKANTYALFTRPAVTYNQNRGLDINNDGVVTKQEAAAKIRTAYDVLKNAGQLTGGGAPINTIPTQQNNAAAGNSPVPAPGTNQAVTLPDDPRDAPCHAMRGQCVHISTCRDPPNKVERMKCGGGNERICCVPPQGILARAAGAVRTGWNAVTNAGGAVVDRARTAVNGNNGQLEAGMIGPIRYMATYEGGRKLADSPCVKVTGQDADTWFLISTASAFMKMNAAYRQATGRHIRVVSGFRTMERQTELYNGYVARRPGYNLAARPGTSNHQNGKALDLGVAGDSALYPWLKTNAHTHGFVRTVPSENWHWEHRPGQPRASYT